MTPAERLEIALVDGIVRAIEEKDYRAVQELSDQLERMRGKAAPDVRGVPIKEAAIALGLSTSKMYELADHVAMRGAVYVVNPGGKNKRRRIDVGAMRKILQSVPEGSYYKR